MKIYLLDSRGKKRKLNRGSDAATINVELLRQLFLPLRTRYLIDHAQFLFHIIPRASLCIEATADIKFLRIARGCATKHATTAAVAGIKDERASSKRAGALVFRIRQKFTNNRDRLVHVARFNARPQRMWHRVYIIPAMKKR